MRLRLAGVITALWGILHKMPDNQLFRGRDNGRYLVLFIEYSSVMIKKKQAARMRGFSMAV